MREGQTTAGRQPSHRQGLSAGSLVRARAIAALVAVDAGTLGSQAALQVALDSEEGPLAGRDRGLCTELVYGTLRRQRALDRWIAASCQRGLVGIDPWVLAALRVGAYQLIELRIPDFAAVTATVDAIKQHVGAGKRGAGEVGFVHAVLRKLAARGLQGDQPDGDDLPPWIAAHVRKLAEDLHLDGAALLGAFCQAAPTHVHALHGGGLEFLQASGLALQPLAIPGAAVADVTAVQHAGLGSSFLLQDGASTAVTAWLDVQPGWRVLDVAAGRGVKSAAMAAAGAQVTALDVAADKLRDAAGLAQRVGTPLAATIATDAAAELPVAAGSFDAVLVDAPCTGLGTLRRRPEIRHRRRAADVFALAQLQRQIADRAAPAVKPGGILMLATCSIAREEGPGWVDDFLRDHPEFARDRHQPAWTAGLLDDHGDLRTHPLSPGAVDGFYAARLRRR